MRSVSGDMFERMGDAKDDRSFTEQMNDLGVEVLPMSALGPKETQGKDKAESVREETAVKKATEKKDIPATDNRAGQPGVGQHHNINKLSDGIVQELIDVEGLKGRLSVQAIRSVPREKLEQMCLDKEPGSKMAQELGLSPAAVNSFRKFYRLRAEDLGHRKPQKPRVASNENSIGAKTQSAEQMNEEALERAMERVKVLTEELYGKPEPEQVDVQELPWVAEIPDQETPLFSIHGEDEAKVFAQAIIGLAKTLNAMGEREVSVFVNVYKVEGESE